MPPSPRRRVMNLPADNAVLIVVPTDVPANPGSSDDQAEFKRWRAGEVLGVVRVDHKLGWAEFPQNTLGSFTVAQINSRPANSNTMFETVRCLDAGTITVGTESTDVVAGDAVAWIYPGYWRNYGPHEDRQQRLCLCYITDQTAAAVRAVFSEEYNLKVNAEVIAGPDPEGLRQIRVGNSRMSATGALAFTDEGTQNVVTEWNAEYPESELVRLSWQVDEAIYEGKFTDGQKDEFIETVEVNANNRYYRRRRWYLPPAVLQNLFDNNRWQEGDLSQFQLRDRMLD